MGTFSLEIALRTPSVLDVTGSADDSAQDGHYFPRFLSTQVVMQR
jgi:hypothetical protein